MRILCHLLSIFPLLSVVSSKPVDLEAVLRIPTMSQHNSSLEKEQGWIDPRLDGGSFLDLAIRHHNRNFGEPLNVIISSLSDPFILSNKGLISYAKSIGYSEECLNLHFGTRHLADLGDGLGPRIESLLARQYFFRSWWGTCWESIAGGHHFRAWKQVGSSAWFIGASKEENSSKHHIISPNGYNCGRDWFVSRAVSVSRWNGMWWIADVEWRTGLLKPGVNGSFSGFVIQVRLPINHGISQDGKVAILTVNRLTEEPESFTSPSLTVVVIFAILCMTFSTTIYYLCTTWIWYPLTRALATHRY